MAREHDAVQVERLASYQAALDQMPVTDSTTGIVVSKYTQPQSPVCAHRKQLHDTAKRGPPVSLAYSNNPRRRGRSTARSQRRRVVQRLRHGRIVLRRYLQTSSRAFLQAGDFPAKRGLDRRLER